MPALLLIAARPIELGGGWTVTSSNRLDVARQRVSEQDVDAVLVDFRDVRRAADLAFLDALPRLAVVPPDRPGVAATAAEQGFAVVPPNWAAQPALLRRLVERECSQFARDEELRMFKKRQRQMVHAEKFAAVGLLAAEIAHEINNPATFVITNLTVMMEYVETLAHFHAAIRVVLDGEQLTMERFVALEDEHEIGFLSEDLETLLARSLAGLNRIHQIVQDLRFFAHDRAAEAGPVDLGGLVYAAMNLVRHEARFHATVEVEVDGLPQVRSDANRISQAILNVLVNAVQSIPAGDAPNNFVRVRGDVADEYVDIVVSDTGVGIAPDRLDKIFEPFFTTKEPGTGTGLGLAISRDVMLSLGGDILAESTPGAGSTFRIRVPRETSR